MNISSAGSQLLTMQMQKTNAQQSATMSSLKGAMHSPQQFLQLLTQSVDVQQMETAAEGVGMIIDVKA